MLTTLEEKALNAIDHDALRHLLLETMAVPSVTGTAAESELQHRLARVIEHLGLDIDLWQMDLPELYASQGFPGIEAERDEAWGLVGYTPEPHDGRTLILQGHTDVVPAGELARWDTDPFAPHIVGDTVYGRGACDMKAGVVANIAALAAIRAAGVTLDGRVALQFVVSEEDGGLGAFGTIARGHTGDACIITEPTSQTVITANGGALTFTISVPGSATHASTRYVGTSAIDNYIKIHTALKELEQRRNDNVDPLMAEYPIPYCLSVGTINAGEWSSTVPDQLICTGRVGVAIGEDPAEAQRDVEKCVAKVCAADPFLAVHPADVAWTGGQFASGRLEAGHYLIDLVRQAHCDATGDGGLRERGAPYGSDLRLYAAADIPTLHYGPGDVRLAHSTNEHVDFAEVSAVTQTLVLTVMRNLGAH